MPETGPHVTIATFCQKVLTEQDGVLSLIRVVDRFTQTARGTEPPEQMPPFILGPNDLSMVIVLKPDKAKGRFSIKIDVEDPSGLRKRVGESDITLPGGNQGANLVIGMSVAMEYEGVYWFDVLLGGPRDQEDALMTRVPLEVQYQRLVVPESQAPES